jgi:hypothetical protein
VVVIELVRDRVPNGKSCCHDYNNSPASTDPTEPKEAASGDTAAEQAPGPEPSGDPGLDIAQSGTPVGGEVVANC